VKTHAEDRLRAFVKSSLDDATREEEAIGFDQVAAYVDGQLDDVDREIFESRLADDPALQAEVADLTAMREAMSPAGARTAAAAGRGAGTAPNTRNTMSWIVGALALAAGLTAAVIWVAATMLHRSPASTEQAAGTGAPGAQQPRPSTTAPPQPPAELRVALQDAGGSIGLDAAGGLIVPAAVAAIADGPKQDAIAALRAGTLPPTALPRDVRGNGPLTLMSEPQARAPFGVIAPVATGVRDSRPVFRWQQHPHARAYTVVIFTDRLERVAASGELRDTTWTPAVDLKAGTTYQWQVTALTPDGPALTPAPPQPEARFRVLNPTQRRTLDQQLTEAGSSNLLRGLALTRAGVLDEAEGAFNALAAANPASPIARDLLTSLRRLRDATDKHQQ
jgi:hypothetical protein